MGGAEQTAVPWRRVAGLAHEHATPLSVGAEYFSELRVTNHLGQRTTARTDGFLVVPTAAGAWAPGLVAPSYAASAVWPLDWAALAPGPDPQAFHVAIGTGVAVDNLLRWRAVGAATRWTWDGTGAALVDGHAYWATVLTRAGVRATARVVLDASAPVAVPGVSLTVTADNGQVALLEPPVPHRAPNRNQCLRTCECGPKAWGCASVGLCCVRPRMPLRWHPHGTTHTHTRTHTQTHIPRGAGGGGGGSFFLSVVFVALQPVPAARGWALDICI